MLNNHKLDSANFNHFIAMKEMYSPYNKESNHKYILEECTSL